MPRSRHADSCARSRTLDYGIVRAAERSTLSLRRASEPRQGASEPRGEVHRLCAENGPRVSTTTECASVDPSASVVSLSLSLHP